MEFDENRSGRPFIGLVLLWRAFKKWHERRRTRHILQKMNDAQLSDIGLSRSDIGKWY